MTLIIWKIWHKAKMQRISIYCLCRVRRVHIVSVKRVCLWKTRHNITLGNSMVNRQRTKRTKQRDTTGDTSLSETHRVVSGRPRRRCLGVDEGWRIHRSRHWNWDELPCRNVSPSVFFCELRMIMLQVGNEIEIVKWYNKRNVTKQSSWFVFSLVYGRKWIFRIWMTDGGTPNP